MDFMDLALLVDSRAKESADRDAAMLTAINEQKTQTALNTQTIESLQKHEELGPIKERLEKIEDTCDKRKEQSWADKTSEVKVLKDNAIHWSRWVIVTLVGLVLAAGGCVGNVMLIRHFAQTAVIVPK